MVIMDTVDMVDIMVTVALDMIVVVKVFECFLLLVGKE